MNRTRRRLLNVLILLLLFLGVPFWLVYREVRQQRLDYALIEAIKRLDSPTAIALLEQGADANARNSSDKERLSFWQILRLKLFGTPVSKEDAPTALMVVFEWDQVYWPQTHDPRSEPVALVRELLDKGANIQDNEGETLLFETVRPGYLHCTQMLLDKGANVNARTADGVTVLMSAVGSENASLDTIQLLLDHHADVNAKDAQGETALDWAKRSGSRNIVAMLTEAGAKQ